VHAERRACDRQQRLRCHRGRPPAPHRRQQRLDLLRVSLPGRAQARLLRGPGAASLDSSRR
jgi:hypothetical protein